MTSGRRDFLCSTPPLSFLLPIIHPLGKTFFLSPVFHCMKNLRWQLNFLWCERSLEKISPALQATHPCVYMTLHHKSHWFLQIWFLRNLILKLTYYPLSIVHLPKSIVWVLAHAITNCYNRNPILFIFMFFICHTNINRIRVQWLINNNLN